MWFQLEGFSLSPQLLLHCPLVEIPKCSTPHVPHVAHVAHHVTLHAFRVSAVVPGAPHQGLACTRRNTLENILVKLKDMGSWEVITIKRVLPFPLFGEWSVLKLESKRLGNPRLQGGKACQRRQMSARLFDLKIPCIESVSWVLFWKEFSVKKFCFFTLWWETLLGLDLMEIFGRKGDDALKFSPNLWSRCLIKLHPDWTGIDISSILYSLLAWSIPSRDIQNIRHVGKSKKCQSSCVVRAQTHKWAKSF